ncbi:hypothetical protein V1264_009981 [Littorina saxatilis]|uniref:Uncharacterized protein n=1 Tax=Littorina saxatilis TaxID=31220 RepID=A0AAN9G125_9CAEN
MGKGNCVFNRQWLANAKYKAWLAEASDKSKHHARCFVCKKDFNISSMGEAALKSHMAGARHQMLIKGNENSAPKLTMEDFVQQSGRAFFGSKFICYSSDD